MFTVAFWLASTERAIKTAAQSVGVAFVGSDTGPGNLFEMDWKTALGAAGAGALFSIITSIASIPLSTGNGPSLAPESEIESNTE